MVDDDEPRPSLRGQDRIAYASPVWAPCASTVGAILVLAYALADHHLAFLPLGIVAAIVAAVLFALRSRPHRREIKVEERDVVVPRWVLAPVRISLTDIDAVTLEPPEAPRVLRITTARGRVLVRGGWLEGGEDALRALAVAVVRRSKALRRASRPPPALVSATVTPRPG
jgi:hypothetical protein